MDALLGIVAIVAMLVTIMMRWLSPLVALIAIPVTAALLAGHGFAVGDYVVDGIAVVAPVAGMLMFAVVFFGILTDSGMFEPFIRRLIRVVGEDPARIALGSFLLAALLQLDGAGATTFLIAVPAFLPLYDRVGIDRRVLACTVAMAAGVNNLFPWGGPTLRAAAALELPVTEIYNPMIPVQIVGLCAGASIAWWLGRRERMRVQAGVVDGACAAIPAIDAPPQPEPSSARGASDWRLWANCTLTALTLGVLLWNPLPSVVVFMLATVVALLINCPGADSQRERVDAHAKAAFMMASVLFAAGAFGGIMHGAGFFSAMANAAVGVVPESMATHVPVAIAALSTPMSLVFDPDSYYFGILPLVSEVLGDFGVPSQQVAQASLIGQMTTGFPISPLTPATFLLIGLARIDLASHQRFTLPCLCLIGLLMTLAAVALGLFPL